MSNAISQDIRKYLIQINAEDDKDKRTEAVLELFKYIVDKKENILLGLSNDNFFHERLRNVIIEKVKELEREVSYKYKIQYLEYKNKIMECE